MSDVRSDRFFCLASNSSSLRFCLFLASLRFLQPTMPSASSLAVEFNDPWIFRIFSLVATSFCATFPLDEDEFPIFFVCYKVSIRRTGWYHLPYGKQGHNPEKLGGIINLVDGKFSSRWELLTSRQNLCSRSRFFESLACVIATQQNQKGERHAWCSSRHSTSWQEAFIHCQ